MIRKIASDGDFFYGKCGSLKFLQNNDSGAEMLEKRRHVMLKDFVCPLREEGCPGANERCTVPVFHYCNTRVDVQQGYGTPGFKLEVRTDVKKLTVSQAA